VRTVTPKEVYQCGKFHLDDRQFPTVNLEFQLWKIKVAINQFAWCKENPPGKKEKADVGFYCDLLVIDLTHCDIN